MKMQLGTRCQQGACFCTEQKNKSGESKQALRWPLLQMLEAYCEDEELVPLLAPHLPPGRAIRCESSPRTFAGHNVPQPLL